VSGRYPAARRAAPRPCLIGQLADVDGAGGAYGGSGAGQPGARWPDLNQRWQGYVRRQPGLRATVDRTSGSTSGSGSSASASRMTSGRPYRDRRGRQGKYDAPTPRARRRVQRRQAGRGGGEAGPTGGTSQMTGSVRLLAEQLKDDDPVAPRGGQASRWPPASGRPALVDRVTDEGRRARRLAPRRRDAERLTTRPTGARGRRRRREEGSERGCCWPPSQTGGLRTWAIRQLGEAAGTKSR
jgi:hypothetical protein